MSLSPSPGTDALFEAMLSLRSEEECRALIDDLCTIRERFDMAQRLAVAVLLRKKKSYLEISAETGASTATISRVARCLNGPDGGYRLVLGRLDGEDGNETDET